MIFQVFHICNPVYNNDGGLDRMDKYSFVCGEGWWWFICSSRHNVLIYQFVILKPPFYLQELCLTSKLSPATSPRTPSPARSLPACTAR